MAGQGNIDISEEAIKKRMTEYTSKELADRYAEQLNREHNFLKLESFKNPEHVQQKNDLIGFNKDMIRDREELLKKEIKSLGKLTRLQSNPYLQAISSAMQAYEVTRSPVTDQPSAMEQYAGGIDEPKGGYQKPRIEQKQQPKLGLNSEFNY